MHEVSLVRNIFKTLEAEFSEEELARISDVDLKVGLLSNVEPALMQNAFEAVKMAEGKYQKVTLNIELVPIEIHCELCGKDSKVENYKFVCECGRPSNQIVRGMELLIERVHFEDHEPNGQEVSLN